MTNRMFGIVALSATMLMAANCGGPVDPPDGGDGGEDGGCEPAKADSTCPPDGGQLDFTATVKAFAPAEGLVGTFWLRHGSRFEPAPGATPALTCDNANTCTFAISKSTLEEWRYEEIEATKRVFVDFKPANGLYVTKDVGLENGKSYETHWGEGEGGIDPGGRTYRGPTSGTYPNVRAMVDTGTGKVVVSGLPCGPFLTITNFSRSGPNCGSITGYISADLATIHVELRRQDGSLNYEEDAVLIQ